MRASIEHREKKTGIQEEKREYFVDTTVAFSEEEKWIIDGRKLYDVFITVGYPTQPFVDDKAVLFDKIWKYVGLVGIAIFVVSPFTGAGLTSLGSLLMLAAGGMFAYVLYVMYIRSKEKETVSIKEIIENDGRFSVYAPHPSNAKQEVHPRVREQLGALKDTIMDCAEMGEREIIDL